jgi:hypothetical protein
MGDGILQIGHVVLDPIKSRGSIARYRREVLGSGIGVETDDGWGFENSSDCGDGL